MAFIFPLALGVFADRLPLTAQRFYLNEPVQSDGSADGEVFEASNADARWQGSFTTRLTKGSEGKRLESLMDILRGPNKTFLMRDITYVGPQLDPLGAILAHRDLALADVDTARIKIGPASGAGQSEGFPPELILLPGDMIGWQYGSNPVRYALHRVSAASESYGYDAAGVSGWIDLAPNVRGAPEAGDPVTLVKPVCKAILAKDTIQGGEAGPGGSAPLYSGWAAEWRQTFL